MRATTKNATRTRVFHAVRATLYMILIVLAFYLPAQWLIPDEHGFARWGVWCLGWTAAYAVQFFQSWYMDKYRA